MNNQASKLYFRIEYLSAIDSTNLEAVRRAERGEAPGLVLVADFQSAGRGRLGRTWEAKPGSSLLASVLISPDVELDYLGLIPLISGASLAESVAEVSGFKPGLIWPNDIFGRRGKIGGILVESRFENEQLKFLVIGSGVNLSQTKEDFPEEIRERASSVFLESGRVISRDELLRVYLGHLWDALEKLEAKKFSELVENYSEWDIIRGKEIRLMMVEKEIVGIVSGIDERGRLKVKSEGKEMIFFAGEINMLRGV